MGYIYTRGKIHGVKLFLSLVYPNRKLTRNTHYDYVMYILVLLA